ncbi:hypothetical protein [Magnetospirillum gryphiswaldense]|uniref:hypothetical protein n=1 Tax=Magnetospirillum gryphiswaldense TaxID=55518 RepID=UPI00130E1E91|nr:hypothetical protein [Magnetospirillum gryphiswaldense]
MIGFDEDIDGFLAGMDLDTNGGIPKIHLVAASVTSPDDCAWHHDPPEIWLA